MQKEQRTKFEATMSGPRDCSTVRIQALHSILSAAQTSFPRNDRYFWRDTNMQGQPKSDLFSPASLRIRPILMLQSTGKGHLHTRDSQSISEFWVLSISQIYFFVSILCIWAPLELTHLKIPGCLALRMLDVPWLPSSSHSVAYSTTK